MLENVFPKDNKFLFSPAKINTYLDVEAVESDYHSLFLNFVLLDFGDLMLFKPEYIEVAELNQENNLYHDFRKACSSFLDNLDIEMYMHQDKVNLNKECNLIYRAIQALLNSPKFPVNTLTLRYLRTCKLTVQVFKRIPMQMGLGGGSSNAATALAYLGEILCSELQDFDSLVREFISVGSDIPVFLYALSGFYRGHGEKYLSEQDLLSYFNSETKFDLNTEITSNCFDYKIERDISFKAYMDLVSHNCTPSFARTFNLYQSYAKKELEQLGLIEEELYSYSTQELAKLLYQCYVKREVQHSWRKQIITSFNEHDNKSTELLLLCLPHKQRNDTTKIFSRLRQKYNLGQISYDNLGKRINEHFNAKTGWYNVFEHYLELQKFQNPELNRMFTLTGTGAASFASYQRVLNKSLIRELIKDYVKQPSNFDFDLVGCYPLSMR